MRSNNSNNALIRRTSGGQRVPSQIDLFRPAALLDDPFALLDTAMTVSPFQLMRRMHEDMDRLFAHTFNADSGIAPLLSSAGAPFVPRVDVSETEKEYHIDVELPGVPQDAIDVRVIEGTLTVRAEMQSEKTDADPQQQASGEQNQQQQQNQQRQYHYRERYWGRFERSFHLPPNADEDSIRAEFKDGVLSLILVKKEPQRPEDKGGRRIAISSWGDDANKTEPKAVAGSEATKGSGSKKQ